jgi:hypothetical protein
MAGNTETNKIHLVLMGAHVDGRQHQTNRIHLVLMGAHVKGTQQAMPAGNIARQKPTRAHSWQHALGPRHRIQQDTLGFYWACRTATSAGAFRSPGNTESNRTHLGPTGHAEQEPRLVNFLSDTKPIGYIGSYMARRIGTSAALHPSVSTSYPSNNLLPPQNWASMP